MGQAQLIERKEQVRAEIAQLRRQLAQTRQAGDRAEAGRRAELENQLQALMAEEHRLRLLIDRTR